MTTGPWWAYPDLFQPPHPVGGATPQLPLIAELGEISTCAPRGGATTGAEFTLTGSDDFNPRAPWGRDVFGAARYTTAYHFNPRAP